MKEKYIAECALIQQNCTYTAEAHYILALSGKRKAFWLETIPAVCAALSGALIGAKIIEPNLLPITILSATVSAVAAVINPNQVYQEHLSAACSFTTLKHDARFLRDTQSVRMTEDAFMTSVENLHQRYNELLKAVPPTDDKSFKKAQKVIQAGTHEPDRDQNGNIR